MLHISQSPDAGANFAVGEWLPQHDRQLSDVAERLMDGAGIEPALRPTGLYVIPARSVFCQAGWGGFAHLGDGGVHMCSWVARALIAPVGAGADTRGARAPAIFLHECGHVALGKTLLPVPARLLRVAPYFGAGGHDPAFASVVATLYRRCGIETAVDAYDCGWASVGQRDWAGPDWALDWIVGFAQRHAPTPASVQRLAAAAIQEFDEQFFAREPAWWQWWLKSGNSSEAARGWRRMRESLLARRWTP